MDNKYLEYVRILDSLIEKLDKLIDIEQSKLRSIVDNNVRSMEKYMKEEQAISMFIAGLEKKRANKETELNICGNHFDDMLKCIDDSSSDEISDRYKKITSLLRLFNDISDNSKVAIEVNLANIQATLYERGFSSKELDLDSIKDPMFENRSFTDFKA